MAYQKLQASRAIAVIPSDTVDIPNPGTLAISSTTTGGAVSKLIDANQDFVASGIKVGDIIYSGAIAATVTAVDSATQLSVSTTISTATAYKLYASRDMPNNGCVLYIGDVAAGTRLDIVTAGGDEVLMEGFAAGTFVPVQVTRVKDTATDVTKIIALW